MPFRRAKLAIARQLGLDADKRRGLLNRLGHRDGPARTRQNNEYIHAIVWVAQRSGGRPRNLKEEENNNTWVSHCPC